MGQRLHAIRRSDSGFTLTELLIVIVILGVLTGIVVFAVGAFTDRGEVAACKADMKTVESAVEAYRAQTGAYPAADALGSATSERRLPASRTVDVDIHDLRSGRPVHVTTRC